MIKVTIIDEKLKIHLQNCSEDLRRISDIIDYSTTMHFVS